MTTSVLPFRPDLSLPEVEARELRKAYEKADVILEYGSGGSTVVASEMHDKLIFSVESDERWALNLQHYIDTQPFASPAILHFVDIGPVGEWGRPLNSGKWQQFHRYPLNIWDQSFFRHPDVILIDGRFRAACLAVAQFKIKRPVTILFDDYAKRPLYHNIERLVGKPKMIGRMAIFEIQPAAPSSFNLSQLMKFMTQATYVNDNRYRP